jgi:hypothetical protein
MGLCITSVLLDGLDHGRYQQTTARQVEGNVIGHAAADEQKDASRSQERLTSQN